MSVRSASRGSPAAKSIRLALRTSSIVETRSASFVRWVLRCFGRRCLSSEPTLSAIFLMPFIMCFQGPPGVEPLNHTPLPHVNSLASKLMDGKAIMASEANYAKAGGKAALSDYFQTAYDFSQVSSDIRE